MVIIMELYDYRKTIGQNLATYIRLKGYSKLSFSKLTNISRPTLDKILLGESPSSKTFEKQMSQIIGILGVPKWEFLTEPILKSKISKNSPVVQYSDRSLGDKRTNYAQELLDDLDQLMGIAALYMGNQSKEYKKWKE